MPKYTYLVLALAGTTITLPKVAGICCPYEVLVKFDGEQAKKKTETVGPDQSANFFHFFYRNYNAVPSRKRDIDLSTKITSLRLNTACFFTALRVGLRLY